MVIGVILAAGKGNRMNQQVKKQYMEINQKPLLYYSLLAFEKSSVDQIILVTGEEDVEFCQKEIVDKYGAVNEEDNLTEEEKKEIEKNAEVISFLPIFTTLTVK